MDLDNSKAESAQYGRGQRKGRRGSEREEHCLLQGDE